MPPSARGRGTGPLPLPPPPFVSGSSPHPFVGVHLPSGGGIPPTANEPIHRGGAVFGPECSNCRNAGKIERPPLWSCGLGRGEIGHVLNAKHAAAGTSGRWLRPPSEETLDRGRGPGAALHEQQRGRRMGSGCGWFNSHRRSTSDSRRQNYDETRGNFQGHIQTLIKGGFVSKNIDFPHPQK